MKLVRTACLGLLIGMGLRAEEPARLTLMILNQAQVPAKPLGAMIQELGQILSEAGVSAETIVCPVTPTVPRPLICAQPLRPDRVLIQLLPGEPSRRVSAVGSTSLNLETQIASIVLFANLAQSLAKAGGWSWHELLAHLAAHEVGHALMETSSHTRNGIMRAVWSPAELVTLRHPQALFDREQGKVMKANLAYRCLLTQSIAGQP